MWLPNAVRHIGFHIVWRRRLASADEAHGQEPVPPSLLQIEYRKPEDCDDRTRKSERNAKCLCLQLPGKFGVLAKELRWAGLLALLAFMPLELRAEELHSRGLGGGRERQWQGTVTLSEGRLDEPNPLGIEADEPASMYLESDGPADQQRLVIHQRSSRAYDGFDCWPMRRFRPAARSS